MLKRLITGICFIGTIVGFMFLRKIDRAFFEILAFIFIVIGCYEMQNALKEKMELHTRIIVLVFSLAVVPVYHFFKGEAVLYLFMGTALTMLTFMVINNGSLESVACGALILFYPCALLISLLYCNDLSENSTIALISVFTMAPCADTMAYVVGVTFKGKKLCPEISPNKTVSGGIGGLLGGLIAGVALYFIFRNSIIYSGWLPLYILFPAMGLIAAFLTALGDLAESVIKRRVGIKDMGKILPGHGGILDRVDGTIFCSWFIYAVFAIMIM